VLDAVVDAADTIGRLLGCSYRAGSLTTNHLGRLWEPQIVDGGYSTPAPGLPHRCWLDKPCVVTFPLDITEHHLPHRPHYTGNTSPRTQD